MVSHLARNWWVLALRGGAAILFGILAIAFPGLTLDVLVIIYGAFALVGGVITVAAAVLGPGLRTPWWALLIDGLIGILIGILVLAWPGIGVIALILFIVAWSLVTGIFEIVAAIRLRHEIEGEVWLALSGAVSVIFGLILLFLLAREPGEAVMIVGFLIGFYAILFGVLLLTLAFRLRSWHRGAASQGNP